MYLAERGVGVGDYGKTLRTGIGTSSVSDALSHGMTDVTTTCFRIIFQTFSLESRETFVTFFEVIIRCKLVVFYFANFFDTDVFPE